MFFGLDEVSWAAKAVTFDETTSNAGLGGPSSVLKVTGPLIRSLRYPVVFK